MSIVFDPMKNRQNIALRGLSFERVAEVDFETAVIFVGDRHDYGEVRFIAMGYMDNRLHVLCFTRVAQGIRVISFRKANTREALRYDQAIINH